MTAPDLLAEIKEWRSYHSSAEVTPYAQARLTDIDWLVGEVERLRGLLARLEWEYRFADHSPGCPWCKSSEGDGHDPGCWLAAEINRES